MALISITGVTIRGISTVLPANEINNIDLLNAHNTATGKKIIETTGIHKRRQVSIGQTSLDLAKIALNNFLAELDWSPEDIGLVIYVTQTPDFPFPGNAIQLQAHLDLPKSVLAFDINLGCSGFIYGMWQIAQILNTITSKRALLVVGDTTSTQYSKANEAVNLLFGDAVSVIAVEQNDLASSMIFELGCDGTGASYLTQPNNGARNPNLAPELAMDGMQVFVFGLREVPSSIHACLQQKGWSVSDVDYCIMNQANEMLLKRLGKKMAFSEQQLIISMGKLGNTSSASIPVAMSFKLADRLMTQSNKLLLSGFGVGWSWGTLLYEQPPLKVCKVVDLKS